MRCHKNFQHFILFFAELKKGRGNFGVVYRAFFIEQRIKPSKIKDYFNIKHYNVYIYYYNIKHYNVCYALVNVERLKFVILMSLILTSLKLEKS